MDSGIPSLLELVGRPNRVVDALPVDSPVWQGPEFRLGLSFPSDFKELLAVYGLHAWGDFLHVLHPAPTNWHLHLERAALLDLGALHEIRREYPDQVPFALFPETGGLFPWGRTDNGDTLLWKTDGAPDWWPTVILEARGPEREKHRLTATRRSS